MIIGIGATAPSFDPADIAAFVWDASNLSTLFQDTAAATPVTTTGQAVGRINNLGLKGGDFRNTGATDRPVYTESGALRYLQFDGSDDFLQWLGASGDVDLTGGYYLVLGIDGTETVFTRGFVSAASTSGNSDDVHGIQVTTGYDAATCLVNYGGVFSTTGVACEDATEQYLSLCVAEVETTAATGSTNNWLRVRRVGDGDVVQKGTDAASSGGHPDNSTQTAQLVLGARVSSGSPFFFGNSRIYCGALIEGTATTQQKTDLRAWAASKVGF